MTLSRLEIWMRGVLFFISAVGAFLLTDSTFQSLASPTQKLIVGIVTVGATTVQAFINKSTSQGEAKGPVEVTGVDGEAIEVKGEDDS